MYRDIPSLDSTTSYTTSTSYSGRYPSSRLLFKIRRFGDWILYPSSCGACSVGSMDKPILSLRTLLSRLNLKTETESNIRNVVFQLKDRTMVNLKKCANKKKLNSMVWVRERTIPTERPLVVCEVIANFADRRCHVVSVTDPYGRIRGFLDRSRYFSIK
jgi:hypothetical protein